jgi:multiple sugar transport system substrate-binding protein
MMNKIRGRYSRREFLKAVGVVSGALAVGGCATTPTSAPATATSAPVAATEETAQEGPSHKPITILINDSPWFPGFAAMVELYTETTGNEVNLDVTPFAGMLEKARNAAQSSESEYDVINIAEANGLGFLFNSELLYPLSEIDPDYELPADLISYDNMARWDFDKGTTGPDGVVMGVPINGNIQLYYYRKDLFEEKGITPAKTFDEMAVIAEQFYNPPTMFGNANRANPIWWEFEAYTESYDASIIRLEDDGRWSVGFDKPGGLKAVEEWLRLGRTWAPENYADLGQGDLLALMSSGRLAQAHFVGAAAPNFDDPEQSTVVGLMGATVVPGVTADTRATMSGGWVMSHPANLPLERAKAGFDFVKWLTAPENQVLYAKAGAIPTSQYAYETLADDPEIGWWASAFAESTPYIRADARIPEMNQIREIGLTRMAQIYVDEISAEEGVEMMAREIRDIMQEAGYDVA